ncbi:MAG: endonuclease [Candidatus Ryanbacteria bacterium CG10_big_fil_rev_8_21_14_0_10_43_42]|uniref:Endonuclease n=1 Tax=Candidatus Ryanbacteria bacterium CG10_big_fil_rev_8_21_14_0_10_43_42 TaxID=1974864 RepID=A0A2M8KW78_9BACT|nr:MAG: endonuclease [Candidatus Ryanbacteria bacterium CG10_big_fil_rev_8_21_14_0_10_43_42]
MYYVYIIECMDGSLYTGFTTDPARRFKEHEAGMGSKYTGVHRPRKLVHTESFSTRSLAMKREAEIKSWPRGKKVALIMTH